MVGRSVCLYEGVVAGIGEYRLRVIEVIVFSGFSVDMEFLYCVKMCFFSFLWQCTLFLILFMGPNKWASSIRCSAKLEVVLWLRHAVLCSL